MQIIGVNIFPICSLESIYGKTNQSLSITAEEQNTRSSEAPCSSRTAWCYQATSAPADSRRIEKSTCTFYYVHSYKQYVYIYMIQNLKDNTKLTSLAHVSDLQEELACDIFTSQSA